MTVVRYEKRVCIVSVPYRGDMISNAVRLLSAAISSTVSVPYRGDMISNELTSNASKASKAVSVPYRGDMISNLTKVSR